MAARRRMRGSGAVRRLPSGRYQAKVRVNAPAAWVEVMLAPRVELVAVDAPPALKGPLTVYANP